MRTVHISKTMVFAMLFDAEFYLANVPQVCSNVVYPGGCSTIWLHAKVVDAATSTIINTVVSPVNMEGVGATYLISAKNTPTSFMPRPQPCLQSPLLGITFLVNVNVFPL